MQFVYKAKSGPAKIVDGTIEAERVDQAIKKIEGLGLVPLDVAPVSAPDAEESKKFFAPSFLVLLRLTLAGT